MDGGPWVQVSRLGMPLVNELVIGLPDKDRFNASEPKYDGQFATYVTNPTLPALLDALFRDAVNQTLGTNFTNLAPNNLPRNDLVTAFLTGFPGVNQHVERHGVRDDAAQHRRFAADAGRAAEQLRRRRRRSRGLPERPPSGRRHRRHRAARGDGSPVLPADHRWQQRGSRALHAGGRAGGNVPFTDGAPVSAADFDTAFPYLTTPLPGSGGTDMSSRKTNMPLVLLAATTLVVAACGSGGDGMQPPPMANTAPGISAISDRSVIRTRVVGPIEFSVTDAETPPTS